ncbi:MAG: type II toxin-antitoxin system Phd/YefM family antitoxin [Desulfurispora sp.]|uniref:type II toxin-antitoxin system Phd/YefM family antitoxin n=1 Tax=Desulfurispora sp. TaxID=3014275 RepID=UPI00404A48A4
MEKIIGINEARPRLSALMEALDSPVIITVNSEPRGVLVRYDEYARLVKAEQENKRLILQLAVEKARLQAAEKGLAAEDVNREIKEYREFRRSRGR